MAGEQEEYMDDFDELCDRDFIEEDIEREGKTA